MRNKTTTTITAAALLLAGATWSGPVAAQTPDDPIIVRIDERFVTGQTESVWVDQPLEAGTYTMGVHTSDGYEGRNALTKEQKARQSSERVTVLGHTTNDLDDASEAVRDVVVVTVEIGEDVDGFHIDHAGTGTDWDSVNVDAVTFTRIVPEIDEPLVVETTVPPLVEHPAPVVPETVPETTTTTVIEDPGAPPAPEPPTGALPETPVDPATKARPKYTG